MSLNNPHWENIIQINIANTLLKLDNSEQAQPLLAQALNQGREYSDVEAIARALLGQTRIALDQNQPQAAEELLEEAIHLTRQGDMRRLLAEALQLHSEQQAALSDNNRSLALWDEAQKLFSILHMPEANLEPDWIKETPVETEI